MGSILAIILPALIEGVKEAPHLIDSAKTAWGLLTSHTPATPDQQAQFDAAMEEAYAEFQKSAGRTDV